MKKVSGGKKALGGALSGIRIVDLSTVVAGPISTQMLGDHGADVIKVESPLGDESRRMGPSYRDGVSAHYTGLNRNKRSVSLDLSAATGRDALLRLLESADVLVENFKPGALKKWGLGYDEVLKDRFPRLIYCHITGFGDGGPLGGLPGYDPIAQAFSGMISWNGHAGADPVRIGVNLIDTVAGAYLTSAVLMGLVERARSGRGQETEITLLDAALTLTHPFAADWFMSDKVPTPQGNHHPSAAPYDIFPTNDGYILICTVNDVQFRRLCEQLDRGELADDTRFRTREGRLANEDALVNELRSLFRGQGKVELALRLLKAGVPAGPILDLGEALRQPQLQARDAIVEGSDAYRGIATPIKMKRTPAHMQRLPPRFGEHSREVLSEAGFSAAEIDALIAGKVLMEAPG